jgi:hypothetical protein
MKRFFALVTCVAALAAGTLADDGGKGKNGNNNNGTVNTNNGDNNGNFEGRLVGSTPGEHVAGVASAGAPWIVAESEFNVSGNGRVHIQIRGLLLTANGTVGPVTMVDASVACGDVVAGTTGAVMLTTTGNASIDDNVVLPAPCIAPALLIRIAATTTGPVANGPFIAINGITAGANNQNDHEDRE